jgi:hypothetical protein
MFKIYWTDTTGQPQAQDETNLSVALKVVEEKRQSGMTFVTMVADNPNHVGKPGVASVENGKTPDGNDYDWSKAGRAGAIKRHERHEYQKPGTKGHG